MARQKPPGLTELISANIPKAAFHTGKPYMFSASFPSFIQLDQGHYCISESLAYRALRETALLDSIPDRIHL